MRIESISECLPDLRHVTQLSRVDLVQLIGGDLGVEVDETIPISSQDLQESVILIAQDGVVGELPRDLSVFGKAEPESFSHDVPTDIE